MKLTHRETADICRSLALLLHGGIPLSEGAHLLSKEASGNPKAVLESIGNHMLDGLSLSQAMEEAACFPEQVPGMAAVGEQTGRLEESLRSLGNYYEERHRTENLIKSTLTYPCMILLLMLAVIGVLLVKVLPVFDRIYGSMGRALTGTAATLLKIGQGLEQALPALLAILVLATAAVLIGSRSPKLRQWAASRFQEKWGDSGILRLFNNARFARALSMGLGSGLPLEESLILAQRLLAYIPPAARRCETCDRLLREGEDLARAMSQAELLSAANSSLLSVGLRCGSGDQVMEDMADRLMADAQEALEGAVGKIEPAIVLACSLLVGAILLTVMLPLMGVLSAMG